MVTIKNKKFLVLGGAGFIGSHCSDALLKNGASQVVVMDNLFLGKKENLSDSMSKFKNKIYLYEQDATSYKDLKIIVENHKPDIILNFATKALLYSFEDPSDAYKVNVDIALNTLELLRHNAFERFIHISTSEVFGSALTVPMSEEHPRKPETTYAAGKAAADLAIFSYVNMFKLNALILRPFNNYGPRQNCNALAALIPQTIKRIYEGLPPIVEGDGQQTRDFIYVEDTINQVLQFLDKPQTNNLDYNIGSGKETSIIEIVKSICEIMGYSKDIEFRPERIADVKRHCADIALTESFLGKITLTPLSVGIEKTINWYLEKVKMIRLFKPEIAFESIEGPIKEILESGQLTQGSFLQKFERYVGDYIGVKHAIATTSATTGLHLGLIAMGVKQHDEVLVSDFTFPATGNVICQIGAVPVLVDCEPNSFEINLEDLKKKITPQSKAILVVDPFGQPVNFEKIKKIAEDNNLFVLEDAACAIGAKRNGVYCGAWADMGVFSFHPRKLITTGEGGMITTNNDELANYARTLFSHGSISSSNGRVFIHNGYNYRMPEISAVLGLEQMQKIDITLDDRRKMAKKYFDLLANSKDLIIPLSSSIENCTFQSFVVLLRTGINRDKIIEFMKSKNIEVTIGTYSMHAEPSFERFGYKPGDLKHSYIASTQSLTLPLHGFLEENDLEYIVSSLTEAINQCASERNT